MEHKKKQNRSKYNFGKLEKIGDEILVSPEDVYSALSSLGSFNRRHNKNIVMALDGKGPNQDGLLTIFVTSI